MYLPSLQSNPIHSIPIFTSCLVSNRAMNEEEDVGTPLRALIGSYRMCPSRYFSACHRHPQCNGHCCSRCPSVCQWMLHRLYLVCLSNGSSPAAQMGLKSDGEQVFFSPVLLESGLLLPVPMALPKICISESSSSNSSLSLMLSFIKGCEGSSFQVCLSLWLISLRFFLVVPCQSLH